ncbi:fibronectin type III domain-containing protein [Pseudobacter ginsenosidimutans]|uniref:Fibronectin type III domain protein n=1 Tax=Pseudobacter ginsenosidimutans TaxID=661488 RepID=A0A4Q7MUD8_9BACT|nr:fibronectin type III domain-containing protein [Pseudobacter ginsenosidimutans]QEC40770.1 T9SS type A sorting domain-containing protein [Pseudobacter ginsenosidimutans]RZS72502.1 fibronectin type III domain protein [Pseudobacter ginsenosidimutans]
MKKALLLSTMSTLLCIAVAHAQNVFDPNDAQVRWNSGSALGTSTNPNPNIEGLQKWVSVASSGVSTGSGSFNASAYKAYFINVGGANGLKMCFRLKFPTSYTNPDSASKKYPAMVFFHGAGEPGCNSNGGLYNNERQLVHGGKSFLDKVNSGKFDGFLIYPQVYSGANCWSDWGTAPYSYYYDLVLRVVDSLVKYARVDVDRLLSTGLSNGGAATWSFACAYPQRVAKVAPSAAGNGNQNWQQFIHIPVWFATGDKDTNPNIGYATSSYNINKLNGGDIRWTRYANLGHSVWDPHWAEPDFVPWMNDLHKANPLVFFQRSDFCPDSAINTKLGITPGFASYEWEKDGNLIAKRENNTNTIVNGSSIISYEGNNITVKSFGVYRVRFRRTATGPWSAWSPKPAVIAPKPVTQTPNISILGLKSNVLPAPDGSNTTTLQQPDGYFGYQWFNASNNQQIGTSRTINVPSGSYYAKVVEEFGCGTLPSPNFKVIASGGSPKPDPAKNLTAVATSLTSIQLDWSENPNAGQNETGYEIYRSQTEGGPYTLLHITGPDVLSYLDQGLTSNTTYYYIVRAVSAFGAAVVSNEAGVATELDAIAPTAPSAFTVQATATNYAYLKWTASSDNVGVTKYEIYLNGAKSYTTNSTSFTLSNLDSNVTYTIYVKALDAAGNVSAPSNQVTASTAYSANGLSYKYFEGTGWTSLPNFNFTNIVKTGISNGSTVLNISGIQNRTDNYGILFEGYIKVPTSATYTFSLTANDGANLYVGSPYGTAEVINHDGNHSATAKTGSIYLAAGVHPIAIAYYHNTGSGQALSLTWRNNAGLSEQNVPLSAYFSNYAVSGTAPAAPSNLKATGIAHNKMQLNWTDNSNNETGFEVVRSPALNGTYVPVATVAGTSYIDSNLTSNTVYYYKVRAVGAGGESAYTNTYTEANWLVNGNGDNASGGSTRNLTYNGTITYNTTDKKEGSSSLNFNGTNNYATVNNSASAAFPSEGSYSQRTVAMWIRPTSASYNNRVIFDFGNSSNGLGLRFNGTSLQYGVASSAGTRTTQSLANFASNANWLGTNNWNHVAVVYRENTLRLFLNGVEVSSITNLNFTSVSGTANNASRLGYSGTNNSDAVFNSAATSSDYFVGQMDQIFVINTALTAPGIQSIMNGSYGPSWDTTLVAPSAPLAPTGLAAQLLPGNNVKLTWNDQSSDETGFEVWRSLGNTNNFRLVANVDGGAGATKTYTDSSLFANVTYYYRVRAKGVVSPSAYSNNTFATTVNSVPVIQGVMDFSMTYGTSRTITLNATDTDGDPLVFTAQPLPYFAQIQNLSNGVANMVFNPSMADQGAYTIKVIVSDGFNGFDTTAFSILVNSNSLPVINPVNNVIMNEGASPVKLHLVSNDDDGNDYLVWYSNNLPSFATLVDSGNGRASITFAPSYNASGVYNITLISDDSYGAWSSKDITVTVNELDPNDKIQINMMNYNGYVALWNDVDAKSSNFNVSGLRNIKNEVTTVGIQRMNANSNNRTGGDGYNSGNNSGVFPDNVMRDYLGWGGNDGDDTLRLRVYGLDNNRKYNFVFYASNTCPWCQFTVNSTTTYKIGNETAQIKFWNNQNVTDTIYQVQPSPTGEVIITMIGDAATNLGGYLNALVVEAAFDDGTTPVKPLNLAAQDIANTGVKLTWEDKAYNEQNYKVYRAGAKAGPYTLLNPGANNVDATEYTDLTTQPYNNYYYYIVGSNKHGDGTTSDTIHIATANNKPVLAGLADIFAKTDATVNEDFTVTDNPGDVVTVSVLNKPGFIALQQLGANSYRLVASPTADNIGFSSITIRAEDDKGGITTQSINVGVADKNTRSFYINLGQSSTPAPAPWTNMDGWANPGSNRTNLRDENNVASTISITTVDGWGDVNRNGHRTGNNTGVFPDSVLASGIIDAGSGPKTIRFAGLDQTKRYNLVFVGSINEGSDATNRYVVVGGTVSDTLQARNNTNQSANLNGLTPNAQNTIDVQVSKIGSAAYMVLNGIQIEEYSPALAPMGPTNLYAEPVDRNTVDLSWSDRLSNENVADGFELQRATDSLFTMNLNSVSLGANTTTRRVTGLNPNTRYWFRVRAKVGATFTDFSNRAKTVTPQSLVYLNFNFSTANAGFPWNNTGETPNLPTDFNNLKNQSGQPSGMTISIVNPFNGENVAGINTGNNSGIAPDAVLQSCYWLDNTQVSTLKVSGLNQNKRYRFGFIGSMGDQGWFYGNYTATYTINGRSVYLNSWLNKTKFVYIGNVQPDANGEVFIDFSTTQEGVWGFNSGMIVEAYDDVIGGAVPNMVVTGNPDQPAGAVTEDKAALQPLADNVQLADKIAIKAYPNPFNDFISIDFNNAVASNQVRVDMYDMSGRLVYRRAYGQMPAGMNTLRINTNEGSLGTGIYMVTLVVNGKPVAATKMLRAEKK